MLLYDASPGNDNEQFFDTRRVLATLAKARNKSLLHVDVDMNSNKSQKEVASNDLLILDVKDGWANNSQRSQRDLVILGQNTTSPASRDRRKVLETRLFSNTWRPRPGPWVDDLFVDPYWLCKYVLGIQCILTELFRNFWS